MFFYTRIANTYTDSPWGCDAYDGGDDHCVFICCTEDDPNPPVSTYEEPMINTLSETPLPEKEGYLVREAEGNGKFLVLRCSSGNLENECVNMCGTLCYEIKESLLFLFETREEAVAAAERIIFSEERKNIGNKYDTDEYIRNRIADFPYIYYLVVEFNQDLSKMSDNGCWYREEVYM